MFRYSEDPKSPRGSVIYAFYMRSIRDDKCHLLFVDISYTV